MATCHDTLYSCFHLNQKTYIEQNIMGAVTLSDVCKTKIKKNASNN